MLHTGFTRRERHRSVARSLTYSQLCYILHKGLRNPISQFLVESLYGSRIEPNCFSPPGARISSRDSTPMVPETYAAPGSSSRTDWLFDFVCLVLRCTLKGIEPVDFNSNRRSGCDRGNVFVR